MVVNTQHIKGVPGLFRMFVYRLSLNYVFRTAPFDFAEFVLIIDSLPILWYTYNNSFVTKPHKGREVKHD